MDILENRMELQYALNISILYDKKAGDDRTIPVRDNGG
jgi:hypothetical protein